MSFWNSLCCSDNNKWVHFCMCEHRKAYSVGMHQFWSMCSGRWFPESARWLAAKGRTVQCARELRHIAKTNGTDLPDNTMRTLQKIAAKKEKIYGLASLFSNWRLAKNTVLVVYVWWVSRDHRRLSFLNVMQFYSALGWLQFQIFQLREIRYWKIRHIISTEYICLISCTSHLIIVILFSRMWLIIEPVCHTFLSISIYLTNRYICFKWSMSVHWAIR